MTTMITEVYDALKDAGATDTKSRAAAEAIAEYQKDIYEMKSVLKLHSWMLGTTISLNIAVIAIVLKFYPF